MSKQSTIGFWLIVLLVCAQNASAQLLAHYEFEQDTETQAYDSSGKGNHGEFVSSSSDEYEDPGEPNWVEGNVAGGQALEFNGDLTVIFPAEDMGLRSDTGGVAFWLLMEEGDLQGGINTIWWGGDNTTGTGFGDENETHIHMEAYSSSYWLGGELSFFGQNSPDTFFLFSDPNKGDDPATEPNDPILMNDGLWHHVVCTWGNDDGYAKMYHNGVLLAENTQGTLNYPFTLMVLGSMGSGNRPLYGTLDDVQIYGRSLTPEEVTDVMNAGLALTLPASLPSPANKITEVALDAQFTWTVGDTAVSHTVYLGTDFDDVNEATESDDRGVMAAQGLTDSTYDPGLLEYLQTYYWRVDEVEEDGTIIRGSVWSFTTRNFLVIDDFEAYTDDEPDRIFDVWIDGWDNPEENGAVVGYADPDFDDDEHYVETETIHGGSQAMPLFFDTDNKYCEAYLSLAEDLQDWTHEVEELSLWFKGYSALTGSFTEEPEGTLNVSGSGADIWGGEDEFHFVYKEVTGNVSLVVHVDSLVNTNGFAKAGLMVRDTLESDARNTAVFFTPENGTRLQRRAAVGEDYITDDEETLYEGDPNDPNTFPRWLKIQRTSGGLVFVYSSLDGSSWDQFTLARTMATMSSPVYLGVAVTSHDDTLVTDAVFDHVTLTGTGSDAEWSSENVGIVNNPAEPVFVMINDQAVVYHDDPNATQINDWAQWNIPLQDFSDQGVDLSNVTKLTLGIGQQGDSSTDGGEGTLYVDDIRLYRPSVPVAIEVENGSFELPGTDKKTDFNDVPGWSTDTAVVDSGIDVIETATEGTWGAWLMSGDPSLWQMTDHVVAAGDTIELKVDARLSWLATTLRMTLYTLDDEDERVSVVSQDVALSDVMQEFTLTFKANDVRDAIGSTIGIELCNVTDLGESTWLEIDNVCLILLESH